MYYPYGNNQYLNKAYNAATYYSQINVPSNNNQDSQSYGITNSAAFHEPLNYVADIPIELAKSLEGKYYLGYADDLTFGEATYAWARLYNPTNSGVNLHMTTWTVSDITNVHYTAEVWFNGTPPGTPQESMMVTPANTAIRPLQLPRVKLHYGKSVKGLPSGGVRAYLRRAEPFVTLVVEELGKFIFPPGGSFMIYLSNPLEPSKFASGAVAFGWWEEPI
jgi:hypothetical protein